MVRQKIVLFIVSVEDINMSFLKTIVFFVGSIFVTFSSSYGMQEETVNLQDPDVLNVVATTSGVDGGGG